jgi:phosphoglycerol transferase
VTPDLRGWNRLSLFIAFFSLLAVGMLLDGVGRRLRSRGVSGSRASRRLTIGWAAVLIAVLGIGAVEETSNFYLVDYSTAAAAYHSDVAFGHVMEADLPRGSNVLELPYVPFPEGYHVAGVPVMDMAFDTSYELLRPYLTTTGLNFSFAAIKGRPADWQSALTGKPLNLAVAGAAASGFEGIYVDPRGYGIAAPRVGAWLHRLLGVEPDVSGLDNAWFYDLRPYTRRLDAATSATTLAGLRQATLHPLQTTCGSSPAELDLTNPGTQPAEASLSATIGDGVPGSAAVRITFPDGTAERRRISGAAPVLLQRRLVVPPGVSRVTFSTVATPTVPSGPATNVVVSDATLTSAAFAPVRHFEMLGGGSPPAAGVVAPNCAVQNEATSPLP